jgi:hypothetical protein
MPIIDKMTLKLAYLLCGAGPGGASSISTAGKCKLRGTCLATGAGAGAEAGASLPATDARKRASVMMHMVMMNFICKLINTR